MAKLEGNRSGRFIMALLIVAAFGAAMGLVVSKYIGKPSVLPSPGTVEDSGSASNTQSVEGLEENAAWLYAQALQQGHYAWVVDNTLWMQERLHRATADGQEAVATARQALMDRLAKHSAAKNQLLPTGIPDQYIFAPGVTLEFIGIDEGEQELAEPTVQRTWIRVTYPERGTALRDSSNIPIRSIAVGINVTENDKILKGNIIGNLEIATDWITYDW